MSGLFLHIVTIIVHAKSYLFVYSQLVDRFGNVWHHTRVRKYLTWEEWSPIIAKGRPWFGLLELLRKHPEHFVINTKWKGRAISEFVSLVSLLS